MSAFLAGRIPQPSRRIQLDESGDVTIVVCVCGDEFLSSFAHSIHRAEVFMSLAHGLEGMSDEFRLAQIIDADAAHRVAKITSRRKVVL